MDGETTFETWQPPKNVMLFESISNCLHFENVIVQIDLFKRTIIGI